MKPNSGESLDSSGAVILAAGLSRRMGSPKMLLPWRDKTIIEQSVSNLIKAGVSEIVVVTGGNRERIEIILCQYPVKLAFNPSFENGEMLASFQCGLRAFNEATRAVFMVLGDQPEIPPDVVKSLWDLFLEKRGGIIIPSFTMRRGHPWLVDRMYWQEIINLQPPQTLRDFLRGHERDVQYLNVDTDSILQDLDTPGDYYKHHR